MNTIHHEQTEQRSWFRDTRVPWALLGALLLALGTYGFSTGSSPEATALAIHAANHSSQEAPTLSDAAADFRGHADRIADLALRAYSDIENRRRGDYNRIIGVVGRAADDLKRECRNNRDTVWREAVQRGTRDALVSSERENVDITFDFASPWAPGHRLVLEDWLAAVEDRERPMPAKPDPYRPDTAVPEPVDAEAAFRWDAALIGVYALSAYIESEMMTRERFEEIEDILEEAESGLRQELGLPMVFTEHAADFAIEGETPTAPTPQDDFGCPSGWCPHRGGCIPCSS